MAFPPVPNRSTGPLSGSRDMVQQLAMLLDISLKLNSTQETDRLLQYILEIATDVLDCEASSIMLYDAKRQQLLFAAATGSDPKELATIPVPLEGSLAGTIFRENKPLVINDVTQDPRHFSKVGEKVAYQTRSLLGVPMVMRNQTTGVIEALNKRSGLFSEHDVHLLSIIAAQAAVAIHNAQLMDALQKANAELAHADKLKSDFMAIASHELRTPLGIILGYATFLKEEVEGELSEHAERVLNSAIHMRSLIEDMTNMNLMRLGSLDLALQKIPLQQVMRSALEEVHQAIQAKGHKMSIRVSREPIQVQVDPPKIEQVFVNILNNAIRFTPQNGNLEFSAAVEGDQVHIQISDNGIGIAKEDLERIFEDFYQVESHLVRHHGGMGLGLSIAKGLVTLHRGQIWAESAGLGAGATFHILLPRAQ